MGEDAGRRSEDRIRGEAILRCSFATYVLFKFYLAPRSVRIVTFEFTDSSSRTGIFNFQVGISKFEDHRS